jgi:predicted ATPase
LTIRLEPAGVETITTGPDATKRMDQAQTGDGAVPATETLRYEYRIDDQQPVVNTAVSYPDRFEFTASAEIRRPSSIMLPARRPSQLGELAERFTRVQDTQWFETLVQSLRVLEPDLTSLSLGYVEGRPLIRGHLSNQRPVPLRLLGGGVVRLTELLLAVLIADGGLTLVDEVENGLYYRSLETAWSAINSASAESRSQIFATTHSAECVLAALRAFADVRDEFRLYRLERTREQIRVVEYDYETAESSLVDLGLEVR